MHSTDCPINIEYLNYTIVTSQCKGPDYPPGQCCSGLTELACPIADELNDLSNVCSERFFSYLITEGKYPAGLFSGMCRGNKEELPCPVPPPSSSPNAATRLLLGRQIFAMLLLLLLLPLQLIVWKVACTTSVVHAAPSSLICAAFPASVWLCESFHGNSVWNFYNQNHFLLKLLAYVCYSILLL